MKTYVEEIRNLQSPSARTGDIDYDTGYADAYQHALDDVVRLLEGKEAHRSARQSHLKGVSACGPAVDVSDATEQQKA